MESAGHALSYNLFQMFWNTKKKWLNELCMYCMYLTWHKCSNLSINYSNSLSPLFTLHYLSSGGRVERKDLTAAKSAVNLKQYFYFITCFFGKSEGWHLIASPSNLADCPIKGFLSQSELSRLYIKIYTYLIRLFNKIIYVNTIILPLEDI